MPTTLRPWTGLLVVALCVAAVPAGAYSHGWSHNGMMDGWAGWVIGPVMMLVWIAIAVAIVLLILRLFGIGGGRSDTDTQPSAPAGETALDILKRRFATGEIDAKTFDSMKARLAKE